MTVRVPLGSLRVYTYDVFSAYQVMEGLGAPTIPAWWNWRDHAFPSSRMRAPRRQSYGTGWVRGLRPGLVSPENAPPPLRHRTEPWGFLFNPVQSGSNRNQPDVRSTSKFLSEKAYWASCGFRPRFQDRCLKPLGHPSGVGARL